MMSENYDNVLWWDDPRVAGLKSGNKISIRNGLECVILERVHPTEPCRVCISLAGGSQFGYLRATDLPIKGVP